MQTHKGGKVEGMGEGRREERKEGGREVSLEVDLRCFLGALPPVDFRAVCYIVS